MGKPIPLDEQIIAVLTRSCGSEAAASVLASAETALRDLAARADAADVASLSPLATALDANALRAKASDFRFDSDRMDASCSALRARVSELLEAEADVRRADARKAAEKERDALAAEIADRYPAIVAELTNLVKRITESDARCQRVGITESAEAIGRGVAPHFYSHSSPVMRIASVHLPMPDGLRSAWQDTMSGRVYRGLSLSPATAEAA